MATKQGSRSGENQNQQRGNQATGQSRENLENRGADQQGGQRSQDQNLGQQSGRAKGGDTSQGSSSTLGGKGRRGMEEEE